jgi:hypothetical protein
LELCSLVWPVNNLSIAALAHAITASLKVCLEGDM